METLKEVVKSEALSKVRISHEEDFRSQEVLDSCYQDWGKGTETVPSLEMP
jgi:hypothetical protein